MRKTIKTVHFQISTYICELWNTLLYCILLCGICQQILSKWLLKFNLKGTQKRQITWQVHGWLCQIITTRALQASLYTNLYNLNVQNGFLRWNKGENDFRLPCSNQISHQQTFLFFAHVFTQALANLSILNFCTRENWCNVARLI